MWSMFAHHAAEDYSRLQARQISLGAQPTSSQWPCFGGLLVTARLQLLYDLQRYLWVQRCKSGNADGGESKRLQFRSWNTHSVTS